MDKFQHNVDEINNFILKYCKSNRKILNTAVQDLVKGGGKRLRPILVLLAGKFGNGDKDKLLSIAAGVELLHMATLVHDDIIDDASLRRGQVTAQERFGKNVAVFVGDYLLTKSYTLFADYLSRHSLKKLNKIVRLVCIGEINQFEEQHNIDITLKDYLKRIRRKTALLFAISVYIGAYESGVRGYNLSCLYNFALEMGMTFQIQDDLLDFSGQENKTGKKVGQDLAGGVYTLPVIYLLENAEYSQKARELIDNESMSDRDIELVTEMVFESGAFEESRKLARRFMERSINSLEKLPDIKARGDLEYILNWQLKRQI